MISAIQEFLQRERSLIEKTTKGPWLHVNHGDYIEGPDDDGTIILGTKDSNITDNAAFIANVRTSHAKLLEIVEILSEALESVSGKGVKDLEAKIQLAERPALISIIDTDTVIAREALAKAEGVLK